MSATKPRNDRADVLVIGDGIIGLSVALAVARKGASCQVVGKTTDGQASAASAGLLAASLGSANPSFRAFMRTSRDAYPEWLQWLAERTGIEVRLNRLGILELEPSAAASSPDEDDSVSLGPTEVASLEPAVAPIRRAILHRDDGYVDNVTLMRALHEALRCEWAVDMVEGRGASIEASNERCAVRTEDGRVLEGDIVVVAAGAWSPLVAGLPRPVSVEPVRGQMLLLDGCPLEHAISSSGAYLVPRGVRTLVGSTLERVGFENRTTAAALEHLRRAAVAAVPAFANSSVVESWAGLRPMTPDGLPILGRDPEIQSLVYACGHAKNGILLAPLTATCISAVISGELPPLDLTPFSITRFGESAPR